MKQIRVLDIVDLEVEKNSVVDMYENFDDIVNSTELLRVDMSRTRFNNMMSDKRIVGVIIVAENRLYKTLLPVYDSDKFIVLTK